VLTKQPIKNSMLTFNVKVFPRIEQWIRENVIDTPLLVRTPRAKYSQAEARLQLPGKYWSNHSWKAAGYGSVHIVPTGKFLISRLSSLNINLASRYFPARFLLHRVIGKLNFAHTQKRFLRWKINSIYPQLHLWFTAAKSLSGGVEIFNGRGTHDDECTVISHTWKIHLNQCDQKSVFRSRSRRVELSLRVRLSLFFTALLKRAARRAAI
jgi:hypothetical protein